MKKPFLTVVTRTHDRPEQLIHAHETLRVQTDQDFEHLILVDKVGVGIELANQSFDRCKHYVNGTYVYILDDDDEIVDHRFIQDLKELVQEIQYDVVMVRMSRLGEIYPPNSFWKQPPTLARIGTPNFIVRAPVWKKHIKKFRNPRGGGGGDFFFITSLFENEDLTFYWWDRIVTNVYQIGQTVRRRKNARAQSQVNDLGHDNSS